MMSAGSLASEQERLIVRLGSAAAEILGDRALEEIRELREIADPLSELPARKLREIVFVE